MICVSIGNIEFSRLRKVLKVRDFVEIRLDQNDFTDDDIISIFSSPIQTITTCRPGPFSNQERIKKLQISIEAGATYVDIELESGETELKEVAAFAREHGCKVIISYHNYEKTPSLVELENIYLECVKKGADIVKIACQVITESDSARLLSLYNRENSTEGIPVVAIGMGTKGRVTRIAAPLLGGPFTYVAFAGGLETASGQLDRTTLEKLLRLLKND